MFLEVSQDSLENTSARASFLIKLQACKFIKKETLASVFSYEFCEISKNICFTEQLWATASEYFSPYVYKKNIEIVQDKYPWKLSVR